MRINENRIEERACPLCGLPRPLDWFGPEVAFAERDPSSQKVKRVARHRKHAACWKCRELGGSAADLRASLAAGR